MSPFIQHFHAYGGDERDRTDDPLLAKQVLSQLSYTPINGSKLCGVLLTPRTSKIKQRLNATLGTYFRTLTLKSQYSSYCLLHRKEVIQPHLPIRLPCYDFTPVAYPTFGIVLLTVRLLTSGVTNSHGVTGGVYKARERIHRGMLIRDY